MLNHRPSDPDRDAEDALISDFAADADMAELLEFFVAELSRRIGEITDAHEQGELGRLRTIANQLKGAAGGYGFPAISAIAGELESLLRSSDPPVRALDEKVQALINLCRRASAGIRIPEE